MSYCLLQSKRFFFLQKKKKMGSVKKEPTSIQIKATKQWF